MKASYILLLISLCCFLCGLLYGAVKYTNAPEIKDPTRENRLYPRTSRSLSDYDMDKDGYISDSEMRAVKVEEYKKIGDGTLEPWTRRSFSNRFDNKSWGSGMSEGAREKQRKKIERSFHTWDADHDSKIVFEEYLKHQIDMHKYRLESLGQDTEKGIPVYRKNSVNAKRGRR